MFCFFPFSCSFGREGEMPGKEAEVRKGWLRWSLPVVPPQCEWGSWSEQTSLMSQRGQECGCGSPHIAWLSWERRARWEKRLQCRWKKGITGLEEIAVYKVAFQRASVGILILEKLKGRVRASSCWLRESNPHPLAHRTVSKARQTEKICLEKNWGGPLTQMPHLERTSGCPAEREGDRHPNSALCQKAEEGGFRLTETPSPFLWVQA